ncbi:TetR family transcriptional regulator [Ruegeria sp. ANG-S4]|uniref:TetR/AcrR family transcriptional regulator n=1 Tax=Ruegeria sp. ANG-S4 TaxID=1577904 RepID=UPI00057CC401|nr:TetR/AcrR family transcriptional regulator [Ruegeria sp. ANG-S4]KIC47044.1 TetR family transcriptional regulator [Ruegeria sp. ANG-S4]
MLEKLDDPKQAAILNSAFMAFATYGFKKTSMDDIAKGAGMSRPAVYLHYKNKQDIVRSLTQAYYSKKADAVAQALQMSGSVPEVLNRAIQAQSDGMAEILSSPHGVEMLDATKSMATDIVEQGEATLTKLYSDWLSQENGKRRVNLPDGPEETARTITATLKGIKLTATNAAEYTQRIAQLSALFGAGIEIR